MDVDWIVDVVEALVFEDPPVGDDRERSLVSTISGQSATRAQQTSHGLSSSTSEHEKRAWTEEMTELLLNARAHGIPYSKIRHVSHSYSLYVEGLLWPLKFS